MSVEAAAHISIPREDYKISIEVFEGPLDLLLYLIKKDELNIYDIPIAHITQSYFEYLRMMETLNIELASEFLVMAATLIRIKVRMLLPASADEEEDDVDPRADLVRQLVEYQQYKEAAELLKQNEDERLLEFNRPDRLGNPEVEYLVEVNMFELIEAFNNLLTSKKDDFVEIMGEEYTVESKEHEIRQIFKKQDVLNFLDLFNKAKAKMEAVAYFLALLELIKASYLRVVQSTQFSAIMIYKRKK